MNTLILINHPTAKVTNSFNQIVTTGNGYYDSYHQKKTIIPGAGRSPIDFPQGQ